MSESEAYQTVDTLRPIEEVDYRYPSVAACEQRGPHEVTLDHWPPRKVLHSTEPMESAQCALCGAHVIVTDPPARGVTVQHPEAAPLVRPAQDKRT